MKYPVFAIVALLIHAGVAAQNVSINILVHHSGKVNNNENVFLEVTVCNMDAAVAVPAYRLKPQINVPSNIVSIPGPGHVLPPGWSVVTAKTGQIGLSNGTDTLAAGDCRTLLIAMRAVSVGGPSTVSGNLLFANGVAPGNTTSGPLPGDSPADNHSTSTVEVLQQKNRQ
jgi:hypothetical protein